MAAGAAHPLEPARDHADIEMTTKVSKRTTKMSKRQVQRLAKLAKNFDKAVEQLPDDKGKRYKKQQQEVADTRRRAQMSDGVLRMRVR